MAKTYVVKLEIDGVGTSVALINDLENAVANLEARIKSADLGSNVVKLSTELKAAKIELKSFDDEVESLDPTKTADKFIKLGSGIAGGFAAATGAAALLGIESETLEKTQVKLQGAIAIAVGFRSLAEAKLSEAIGQSVIAEKARAAATGVSSFVTGAATKGVKAFRLALISTGIGALVVAVGLLVAYWDDIKGFVSGVTGEQEKLNEEAEKNVKTQEEGLEAISAQEESLKLQGKSEEEIRDMKIAQTDEIILATQLQLKQMEATKKAQVDAAARNKSIAMGIIAFLSAPILLLLGLIDGVTAGLAFVGVLDEGTDMAANFLDGAASMIFDPEEVAAEGDALIKEQEKQLTKLENSRAGMVNAKNKEIDAENKAASDKRAAEKKTADDQAAQDAKDLEKRLIEEAASLRALNKELALLALDDEFERGKLALEQQETADLEAIAGAENFEEQKFAIEQKYTALQIALANTKLAADKVISDEAIALSDKEKEEKIANDQAVADFEKQLQASKIQTIANGFKLIADLAGESKAAQAIAIIGENAVGIANQIISTQASNIAITAQGTALAIPSGGSSVATAAALVTSNNISLGIGIAGSAAATAKALAALKEGGDTGGGASPGGGGGGAPNLGTPEQTSSIDFGFLGDGDTSQVGETAPVQAYVLGADVSSTLEANQVIKDQSTL